MAKPRVHFATESNEEVRPLCGEWGGVTSWTKIASAVFCLRCRALLATAPAVRRGIAPAPRGAPVPVAVFGLLPPARA